jgi:hypothetical protein
MKRIALFLILGAVFISCAKKQQPKPAAQPVPAPAKPVPVFAASVGNIKGDVQKLLSGVWKPAAAGDSLFKGDCLAIPEKAELELTDAKGGTIKLAGPQTDEVTTLLEKAATAPQPKPESKALKSIKNIETPKQAMEEQTPTAVAGIRGAGKRKPVPDTTQKDSTGQ